MNKRILGLRQPYRILGNDKYIDYVLECRNHRLNILSGSIRSGKTVFNILAFCLYIEQSGPDENLFLAAGVDASLAKLILGNCSGFGISYYFAEKCQWKKQQDRDCLLININGRQKQVIFVGGSKSNSQENIRGLTINAAIVTEINLLDENFVKEILRRMEASKNRGKLFADFNPCDEKHWIYSDFVDNKALQKNGDMNFLQTTLIDNPALTLDQIDAIKSSYDPRSLEYKAFILGERITIGGNVYFVNDYNIISKNQTNGYYKDYIISADIGQESSATVFGLYGLFYNIEKKQFELHMLKEYYHRNKDYDTMHKKLTRDYCKDFCEFVLQVIDEFQVHPSAYVIDRDISFSRELEIEINNNYSYLDSSLIQFCKKTIKYEDENDGIPARMKVGQSLLYTGRLKFMNTCEHTIDHFKSCLYDEKNTDDKPVRKDDPENGYLIDGIDCCDYAMIYFINDLYNGEY